MYIYISVFQVNVYIKKHFPLVVHLKSEEIKNVTSTRRRARFVSSSLAFQGRDGRSGSAARRAGPRAWTGGGGRTEAASPPPSGPPANPGSIPGKGHLGAHVWYWMASKPTALLLSLVT